MIFNSFFNNYTYNIENSPFARIGPCTGTEGAGQKLWSQPRHWFCESEFQPGGRVSWAGLGKPDRETLCLSSPWQNGSVLEERNIGRGTSAQDTQPYHNWTALCKFF